MWGNNWRWKVGLGVEWVEGERVLGGGQDSRNAHLEFGDVMNLWNWHSLGMGCRVGCVQAVHVCQQE